MDARAWRALVFVGSVLMGGAGGNVLDRAGVSPSYDGDMMTTGFLFGIGLGLVLIAFVRDR